MLNSTIKLCILLIFFFLTNSYSQASKIFWIDYNKIQSSSLSGNNVTDIVTGLQMPEGIAIDCTSTPKKIYYSERGISKISRVNFDGSNPEEIVTVATGIKELELDPINRKIYWISGTYGDDKIQRADMDSLDSNIEDVYVSNYSLHDFNGLGVDIDNQWLFLTHSRYGLVDVVKRMTFAGTNDTIIGYNYLSPKDIDVVYDKIYWLWGGRDYLVRANKNGSDLDTILTNIYAHYFQIDTTAGKIFWSDKDFNKISCANLDGTGRTDLVTGLIDPKSIALYVNPLTVSVEKKEKTVRNFELLQNYPNPFNPVTTISFSIPNAAFTSLSIHNILGQKVETLFFDKLSTGKHSFKWYASKHAGGIYFCKLETGFGSSNHFVDTKKLILLK